MAAFWSFSAIFMIFMAEFSSLALTSKIHIQLSSISAAPAFLPEAPLSSSSPALSPGIEPVFPTTGAGVPSPTESSLPTIPSSPSPPNPDVIEPAPGPLMAMPPSGSLPASSASSSSITLNLCMLFLGFMVFCLMQLSPS